VDDSPELSEWKQTGHLKIEVKKQNMQNSDNLWANGFELCFGCFALVRISSGRLVLPQACAAQFLDPKVMPKQNFRYDHRVINTALRPICNRQASRDLVVENELQKVFGVSPGQRTVADVLINFLKIALAFYCMWCHT
jgi:hypothetical protein